MKKLFLYLLTAFALLAQFSPTYALILNDDGIHWIDSVIDEPLYVYGSTQINLLSGADTGPVYLYDSSVINAQSGSEIENVYMYDYSSGIIDTFFSMSSVDMYDAANLVIDENGYFQSGHVHALSADNKLVYAGGFADSLVNNGYMVHKSGFLGHFFNDGTVLLDGGELGGPEMSNNGDITVLDGYFGPGGPDPNLGGQITIFGGNITGLGFYIDGAVTVYGENFSLPFGTYTAADNLGMIDMTGNLKNGSLNWDTFCIEPGGSLTLVSSIPEPATIFLFGAGLVGLAACRRKKIKGGLY